MIGSNRIEDLNFKVLKMLGNYLNNASDFIQKELVDEIVDECQVTREYTFTLLLAAACGLDIDNNAEDKELFYLYFLPMVHQLNPEEYYCDIYYSNIVIPDTIIGRCELKNISYKPYEAFVFNDLEGKDDGRIVPQIGFFSKEFTYPALREDKRTWMSITPNEVETMREPIEKARGKVLTFGLGLGYFAYMVSEKNDVSTVTVIEQNEDVISIFKSYILPQFRNGCKIRIVKGDAFEYASKYMSKEDYDYVFADLWHDVSDGLNMYIKMREYEKLCPNTIFSYWIEKSIRCYL